MRYSDALAVRPTVAMRCVSLWMLAAPSRDTPPAEVVEAQIRTMMKGDVRAAFDFASPANRRVTGPADRFERMVRRTPNYNPLVCCSSFEILSALSIGDRVWRCRVRVRPASSSSAPFAIDRPFVEYRWELSRQAEAEAAFDLGTCTRHKKYDYRGVIVGYDGRCEQPDEWVEAMGVDKLSRGREQVMRRSPFHRVMARRSEPMPHGRGCAALTG